MNKGRQVSSGSLVDLTQLHQDFKPSDDDAASFAAAAATSASGAVTITKAGDTNDEEDDDPDGVDATLQGLRVSARRRRIGWCSRYAARVNMSVACGLGFVQQRGCVDFDS